MPRAQAAVQGNLHRAAAIVRSGGEATVPDCGLRHARNPKQNKEGCILKEV
jgi:hypothetical protein